MSNPDLFGSFTYEAETGWAENVNTYTTHRIPTIGPPDVSGLVHNKTTADFTEQYRGAGHTYVLMTQGGSFTTTLDLTGHGATTAGSPSVDAIETFLDGVFGGTGAFSLATSQTATGGTATIPTMSGATGVTAGGVVRVGALGDGDGDGQFYPVSTHSSSNLNLLVGLRGSPVNGAVVYPTRMIFSNSSPTSSAIAGRRFEIMTANTQYRCHGCFPMSVSFSGLGPGGRPQIAITWGVSWWTDAGTTTFPSVVTSNRYLPSPVAAGSLHVQAVGTATRNELVCRDFTIDYNLGVEALRGSGGVNQYQDIVGAVRTGLESCTIGFTVDAEAAGTTSFADWGRSLTTNRSVAYTLSPNIGSAVGFWFPKVCVTTVPVLMRDGNINRFRFTGVAHTSDTLTSEVTRARMLLCYA